MASKRKSPWTDSPRSRPPPTGQPFHPEASPPPSAVDSATPTAITVAGTTSRASIPLVLGTVTIQQAATEIQSPAIDALKMALESLKSKLSTLPPLQLAVAGLLGCFVQLQVEEQSRQTFDELALGLTELVTRLQKQVVKSKPRNVPHSIANVARAMSEQAKTIKEHQDRATSHLALALEDEEVVLNYYRRIEVQFRQLWEDISLSVWDTQQGQQADIRLKCLAPAYEARYNAALPTTITKRVECTKGTRVALLNDVKSWACDPEGAKVHWLNGMAGTGKTTIAYTLCKMLYKDWQLGASFFCSRNSPDCRDVNKIVPTIAYQLGRYSNPYRQALCRTLEDDPDIAKHDISTQFEQLISNPLAEMGKAMPTDVVVVIDALDECTDLGGTKNVLNLLLQHAEHLPIKFFICSRPEPAISNRMTAPGGAMRSILWLHDIEQSLVQADIKMYLAEALKSIEVTSDEINQLAVQAGSLFIFAATAARYIIPDIDSIDHRRRLLAVLELQPKWRNKSYLAIDELYTEILSNALDETRLEQLELDARRQALHTVVCAREPLTISALAEVLDLPDDRAAQLAIQPLQSVLHVSEGTNAVSILHTSFPNFLLDKERAGRFHCDEALQNSHLAKCCFRVMAQSLRFNICALESSYQLDSEVPDLQNRINKAISHGLFYSCIYWGDHITLGSSENALLLLLDTFMRHQLLFWLEVLNLKGRLDCGDGVLGQALIWLPLEGRGTGLCDLIHDARNFVITFAFNPTSLSTPHIYISSLPFTSRQSHIWAAYSFKMRGLVSVDGAVFEARWKPMLATWIVEGTVGSIAQSSSGKLVASGSERFEYDYEYDGMDQWAELRIWDASSGTCVLGPFKDYSVTIHSLAFSPDETRLASGLSEGTIDIWEVSKVDLVALRFDGHASESDVNSVVFSPDGNRLASGSDDQTIRIWDTYTGAPLGEPLKGHQGAVLSVVFSPNGEHLASGSEDGTIRIWNSRTGTTALEPIEGHTGAVNSIVYSHDGQRLVSGSADCTVRVWDILSGTLLAGPFEGHTKGVNSVSLSPTSTRVASGSADGTIRVWEAASGRLLAGPLEGHGRSLDFGASVDSVLFTVDGARILSGSDDGTIRVWDPRHGTPDATKSEGHTSDIYSVSFSPDGTLVASGSRDGTICVWDAHNRTLVAGPLRGHRSYVWSVAFSPNGARIASGSADKTLRTWNVSTGALLVGPIEGHTDQVWSVAFAPDGSQIASGSWDRTIRLWNSHTGESVAWPFEDHTGGVTSIAYSPDASRIVAGSYSHDFSNLRSNDGFTHRPNPPTVQMWLASDNMVPLWKSNAHTGNVTCVAFSPDGTQVVSSSEDRSIMVLDAGDGSVLHGPFTGHTNWVESVAFSPDGKQVVSGSLDQMVRVWDVESGTTVAGPLIGHTGNVGSVAFSPDGARILSGSDDGTIRSWDSVVIARANTTTSDNCAIDDDGWLTNSKLQRLFWVPSDLRRGFGVLTPSNPVVINTDCTVRIDDTTLLGDRWHECYVASPSSASS